MSLDIDKIFHTETMVKILWEQGHSVHAMKLCEKILEKDPDNESVRRILKELKDESRQAFERFRAGGKQEPAPHEEAAEGMSAGEASEGAELESTAQVVKISQVQEEPQAEGRVGKAGRLEKILKNLQRYRKQNEAG